MLSLSLAAVLIAAPVVEDGPKEEEAEVTRVLSGPTLKSRSGVTIHGTDLDDAGFRRIAAVGFSFVRVPMPWKDVERRAEIRDFKKYQLMRQRATRAGLQVIFVLHGVNPCYGKGDFPIRSVEGRRAFVDFCGEAGEKLRGAIFELGHRPNDPDMWTNKKPLVKAFASLMTLAATRMRKFDPEVVLLGPGISQVDERFLITCFDTNLLEWADAVTIQPRRPFMPETLAQALVPVHELIEEKHPDEPRPRVALSETQCPRVRGRNELPEQEQALIVVRHFLVGCMVDAPLIVWGNWQDTPETMADAGATFGLADAGGELKAAGKAVSTTLRLLGDYAYSARLPTDTDAEFILVFRKGPEFRFVAWTVGKPRAVPLPMTNVGNLITMDFLGGNMKPVEEQIFLDKLPRYYMLKKGD